MKGLETAVKLKVLKEQGLSNGDIVKLVKECGRDAVLALA